MNRLDTPGSELPAEAIADFIALGRRLAAQMAEANFRMVTANPEWTLAEIRHETECAVARMDVGARDLLAARGADPEGENWQAIWEALETGYRETMAGLLKASRQRGGGTLQ